MMPSYGYNFNTSLKRPAKLPGNTSSSSLAATVSRDQHDDRSPLRSPNSSKGSRPTSMETEFNFSSLGYDNILNKKDRAANASADDHLKAQSHSLGVINAEAGDAGTQGQKVVYITQSHSSNMLTILDAIEKGNEKPGMDLDLDLDSGPDSHAQDSDDDMGLVFSPRPMRRSSSAVNVSLDVPHSALRPSNSMIDLPGVRRDTDLIQLSRKPNEIPRNPFLPVNMRPELKRQHSTPNMSLRPSKKTPTPLSPGGSRFGSRPMSPTSPRMSIVRAGSPQPGHRGSVQLKFEMVGSGGLDGEFENIQMK